MRAKRSTKRRSAIERFCNMQTLRRVVQIAFFAAFIVLFALTIGRPTADGRLVPMFEGPVDLFVQIDPLVGLSTMLAARAIVGPLLLCGFVVVLITLIAGRFFCGWICPLGATLDAADAVIYRGRKRSAGRRQPYRNLKYYLLFVIITAAIFSVQLAYLLDPVVIIYRALTFIVYAPVQLAVRALGGTAFLSDHARWLLANPLFYESQSFYRMGSIFFLIFGGIIAANAISRRFWCRNLCPLGALLALVSRVSLIKRRVDNTCRECGKCLRECKMASICDDPRDYIAPECIYCYTCAKVCPTKGIKITPTFSSPQYRTQVDLSRRRTLQAIGIGIGAAALIKTDWTSGTVRETGIKASSPQLIRPPGALPEDEFLDRCVRCSACMKICPTNGLQPALVEAGIEGLWSPVLVPRIGECVQNCNLCSKVCAVEAIQPFEIEEKAHIYIGTAVIDRSACIVWNADKPCLVCDEYCSYRAIEWREVDGVRRPFVNEKKCTGCGICESACPIQPQAAIRVFSFGDKRHMSREEQKQWGSGS